MADISDMQARMRHDDAAKPARRAPRKRFVASGLAALSLVFAGLAGSNIASAETTDTSFDRAERFLAFDTVNDVTAQPFQDVALSAADFAVRDEMADRAAEQQCLAEAVYFEARSESTKGQKAVAEVVLNRVESKFYPDTVCGVVYQGQQRALAQGKKNCQFSFTCDGSMDRWTPVGSHWDKAQDIAHIALDGGFKKVTKDATHYHTNYVRPGWSRRLKRVTTIGTHKFYLDLPHRRLDKQRAAAVSVAS